MLAQIAPHVPALSILLLIVCGTLIGVALTGWGSPGSAELARNVQSLREENGELQVQLRRQQELRCQYEEHQRAVTQQSEPLRDLAARLELTLRHRQLEQGSIEDGLRTLRQLAQATLQDVRAAHEQRGEVVHQFEAMQAELLTRQQALTAVTGEVRAREAEIEQLRGELAAVRQERERLAEERDAAADALEEAGEAYPELQRDVDSHRRAIDSVERQRGQADLELQSLQQQVIAMRVQGREHQELKARFDAACQELAEARRQQAILRSQLAEALESQHRWQLELQTENASTAADRERIAQLEGQLASAEQQADRIRADRESLLGSLRGAQAQNRELTQQLGDQDRLIHELQDETASLRLLWEQRITSSVAASLPAASEQAAGPEAAARVEELERQVEELREQLRMAQVQAHELIQRQPAAAPAGPGDATVRQLQHQVYQQSRAITDLERDRQELLCRIQRQNQLLEDRAA